jgi:hypothetical protein
MGPLRRAGEARRTAAPGCRRHPRPGGFGERGIEGKIAAARTPARTHALFRLCLGMQVMCIEFARHVLGLGDANSTEFNPKTPEPVISLMPDQQGIEDMGGTMRLRAVAVRAPRAASPRRLRARGARPRAPPPPVGVQQPLPRAQATGQGPLLLGPVARRPAGRNRRTGSHAAPVDAGHAVPSGVPLAPEPPHPLFRPSWPRRQSGNDIDKTEFITAHSRLQRRYPQKGVTDNVWSFKMGHHQAQEGRGRRQARADVHQAGARDPARRPRRRPELQLPPAPDRRQGEGREHAQGKHRARHQARGRPRRRCAASSKKSPTRATARTASRSTSRPSPTTRTAPSARSAARSPRQRRAGRVGQRRLAVRAEGPDHRRRGPARTRTRLFELALDAGAEDVHFGDDTAEI